MRFWLFFFEKLNTQERHWMGEVSATITYFTKPGKENTERVLELAGNKAEELRLKTVLVASTTGFTALKAVEKLKSCNIVVVTHAAGYTEPDAQEFDTDIRAKVEAAGVRVVIRPSSARLFTCGRRES